jgi:Xaa-Pro aminopeptidase
MLQPLAFHVDEYRARLAKVQAVMAARGLDALLLKNRADVCYLTGMETCYMVAFHAAVVPAVGDPILLASEFEMLNARLGAWCEDRVTFAVQSDPIETVCRTLRDRGLAQRRIGVELQVLTAEQYKAIERWLPVAALLEAGDILPRVKVIKSSAEIAYLRESARLSTLGMQASLAEVRAGRTDNDVAAAASAAMIRGGSEFMCIEPIVTTGGRSGIPHSTFHRTVIRPGDAIFIEVGACVCRYSAPLMRTAAVTPVADPIRRAADACHDSLNALIEHMLPGMLGRDVALKAKAAWTPLCKTLIWHGIYAYSVGIGFPPDWNDAPLCITEDSDVVLLPGMCFHATTSLREAGKFGTAFSETVLITEKGNEVLTGTMRELFVIS